MKINIHIRNKKAIRYCRKIDLVRIICHVRFDGGREFKLNLTIINLSSSQKTPQKFGGF